MLIAYSLPDVPHDALVDLHFPLQGLVPSNPGDELSCPADAIPPAVQENVFLLPHHPKLFLDLCSGATSPLAAEALARGIPSLPVDILLDSKHDLLQDCTFEQLLRLAFAGRFAFAHASPPCTEYSRLKLRPGPGPPPCRSPDHLRGLPSNDAAAALRVVRSRTILERCVQILLAVYQCGGHCDLEQPRNAMSWLEPAVQGYMLDVAADLVVVAACAYGCDLPKHWLFASSWRQLQALASVCTHAEGTHAPIHGLDSDGNFRSRRSAQFPVPLCKAFADCIQDLFSCGAPLPASTVQQVLDTIPVRPVESFPVQLKMGPGSTVSLIGQLHLRGLRMSSNHCDKIFTISSCSAGSRHACVKLSQISARTPCLQHLKWLTCAHCGSNGPRHRATQVPSTGRSLQVSLMPLRHGRDWQVCLRIGM